MAKKSLGENIKNLARAVKDRAGKGPEIQVDGENAPSPVVLPEYKSESNDEFNIPVRSLGEGKFLVSLRGGAPQILTLSEDKKHIKNVRPYQSADVSAVQDMGRTEQRFFISEKSAARLVEHFESHTESKGMSERVLDVEAGSGMRSYRRNPAKTDEFEVLEKGVYVSVPEEERARAASEVRRQEKKTPGQKSVATKAAKTMEEDNTAEEWSGLNSVVYEGNEYRKGKYGVLEKKNSDTGEWESKGVTRAEAMGAGNLLRRGGGTTDTVKQPAEEQERKGPGQRRLTDKELDLARKNHERQIEQSLAAEAITPRKAEDLRRRSAVITTVDERNAVTNDIHEAKELAPKKIDGDASVKNDGNESAGARRPMTEQEAADLLNEHKIKTPDQQVAGEDDDFDLGKEKLRLMGMLAHDTTIGVQERAALRGEIFNADAESIKTIEAQLNASKQNTAPTQSKSSTPPPIPAVSPRPTAGAPAVNTPPNQLGGKQMFNTSWDRGMDRWREEQENKKTIRNISRDTIKDPVQKGFEEHARQKAEGKDAASLLEGALNKRKSFWDRNAGALGVMASPVKRLIEGYGKLDWKKRVAIGAAIGGAAALATGGLGTLGYGLLAGAGRTGAGMAGGALGGELSRKFFATDTVRAWAESNPKKAALAHVVGAMGGGVLMAMLFNEFGSPQLASLVSGPSEQMLAFPDTLPDDSTPGTIVDPSSAGNTATEIPTAPEVPAEAPTSAAESSAPMMRVAPESMAGANAAAPSFADAHVIPGNEIAPDAESAPTTEVPSNDSAQWIDYADRYDPYVVAEGDAAFARGLWGHMMDNMAGIVHTDAFAEFIGTVVPEASQQSFIQALHKTLIENPDFMNTLSGGSMTPNDIVLEDGMYYTIVHNGDQIKLAELFKNDDFVKAFGETIKGGNFSTLQVAMDNGGGVDTILEKLHTKAGPAEEGVINIGAEVVGAQSSLAEEGIGSVEPGLDTPQTVLGAQEATSVGVLENIVPIPAGYESVAGQLYDILFKDITTTTPEEVMTQFVARVMEELSGRGIGPEIAISELSTEAGPDVIKSVLDDMNTDGISFSDRVWLEGMYKGQMLPETGIPEGAINV